MCNMKYKLFDNNGETWDRYTLLIYRGIGGLIVDIYTLSEMQGAGGFNQYCTTLNASQVKRIVKGEARITISKLSKDTRKAVKERIASYN